MEMVVKYVNDELVHLGHRSEDERDEKMEINEITNQQPFTPFTVKQIVPMVEDLSRLH